MLETPVLDELTGYNSCELWAAVRSELLTLIPNVQTHGATDDRALGTLGYLLNNRPVQVPVCNDPIVVKQVSTDMLGRIIW